MRSPFIFFQYAFTHLLFFIASARPVFSIRINASACRYCLSPTGECVLKFSLSINLSVQCKLSAPIKTLAPLSSLHRYGHRSYSECRQLSWTGIPKGGLSVSAQSQCDNVCTKSLLYVTIRATAITTRNGVRSLLKKLFFGRTKKSFSSERTRDLAGGTVSRFAALSQS